MASWSSSSPFSCNPRSRWKVVPPKPAHLTLKDSNIVDSRTMACYIALNPPGSDLTGADASRCFSPCSPDQQISDRRVSGAVHLPRFSSNVQKAEPLKRLFLCDFWAMVIKYRPLHFARTAPVRGLRGIIIPSQGTLQSSSVQYALCSARCKEDAWAHTACQKSFPSCICVGRHRGGG